MSFRKNIVITVQSKQVSEVSANELTRNAMSKVFATSIPTNKVRMDIKMTSPGQQEESLDDNVTLIMKPPQSCVRGKKRRLDHLTWEEKLQRK